MEICISNDNELSGWWSWKIVRSVPKAFNGLSKNILDVNKESLIDWICFLQKLKIYQFL